jgi:hypothetical protein
MVHHLLVSSTDNRERGLTPHGIKATKADCPTSFSTKESTDPTGNPHISFSTCDFLVFLVRAKLSSCTKVSVKKSVSCYPL